MYQEENRFAFMHAVRKSIAGEYPNIRGIFHQAFPYYQDGRLEGKIFSALNRRLNTISVRSSFVFLVYYSLQELAQSSSQMFKSIKLEYLKKIAFLADAAMSVMYMYNHLYDQKCGINTNSKSNNTLMAANVLKDLIYQYSEDLPCEQVRLIHDKLRRAFIDVELGQSMDKNYGFDTFISNLNPFPSTTHCYSTNQLLRIGDVIDDLKSEFPNADNAIDVYFTRIYLINSSLLKALAEILIELTGFRGKEVEYITSFSELMGVYMQVVNDNTDFIYDNGTSNKQASDTLSDLRNGTISMPIILQYHTIDSNRINSIRAYINDQVGQNSNDQRLLSNFPFYNQHDVLLREIILSGAMRKSMDIGKKIATKAMNYFVERLDPLPNSCLSKLADMTDLAFWNRYYYHVKKAKPYYNRGELYRCADHLSNRKKEKNKRETLSDS